MRRPSRRASSEVLEEAGNGALTERAYDSDVGTILSINGSTVMAPDWEINALNVEQATSYALQNGARNVHIFSPGHGMPAGGTTIEGGGEAFYQADLEMVQNNLRWQGRVHVWNHTALEQLANAVGPGDTVIKPLSGRGCRRRPGLR